MRRQEHACVSGITGHRRWLDRSRVGSIIVASLKTTGGEKGWTPVAHVEEHKVTDGREGSLAGGRSGGEYLSVPATNDERPLQRLLADLSLTAALTPREREVLAAAVRGLDTKVTAIELGVSPKTVDEMWRRVYRKTGCRSRVEVLSRLLASCFRLLVRK
jgi:DNA-binding CsgD family transcriptional regulator